MAESKRILSLDAEEHGLLVNGLNEFRNECLREGKPTEDVEDLILKAIDAPTEKGPPRNWRFRRERSRGGVSELSQKAEARDTKRTTTRWFEREDR